MGRGASDVIVRCAAMLLDKLAGIDPASRVLTVAGADERRGEFAHLKMQMSQIPSACASDRADLFAATNILLRLGHDRFEVRVV